MTRKRMPPQPPRPFNHLVLEAVLGGASTVAEVLAVVGRYISAARAVGEYRHKRRNDMRRGKGPGPTPSPDQQAQLGRHAIVGECLRRLAKAGRIVRLSPGVYSPPPPRLFVSPQAG